MKISEERPGQRGPRTPAAGADADGSGSLGGQRHDCRDRYGVEAKMDIQGAHLATSYLFMTCLLGVPTHPWNLVEGAPQSLMRHTCDDT